MIVIGLTGRTASGKSTVSKILNEHGFHVIFADLLGHESYKRNTQTYSQLVEVFGPNIIAEDKTIDRNKLGPLVFYDAEKMKSLTDIVWPAIKTLAFERIQSYRRNHPRTPIVFEAAILLEAGWQNLVDEIWLIVSPPEQIISRALARDQTTQSAIAARLNSQLTDDERISQADVCIHNNRGLAQLELAVEEEVSRLYGRLTIS